MVKVAGTAPALREMKKKIEQIWSFNENCCKYLKLQGVVKMCKQWGNPHWELQGGLGEGVFELSAEG